MHRKVQSYSREEEFVSSCKEDRLINIDDKIHSNSYHCLINNLDNNELFEIDDDKLEEILIEKNNKEKLFNLINLNEEEDNTGVKNLINLEDNNNENSEEFNKDLVLNSKKEMIESESTEYKTFNRDQMIVLDNQSLAKQIWKSEATNCYYFNILCIGSNLIDF